MYNITIICGGTGSIALQNGFYELYGNDCLNISLIINAYDNGKSTGECRKVFQNRILGPSDLRKNQMTQYAIQYKEELKDPKNVQAKIRDLFETRFSASNYKDYYCKAEEIIKNSDFLSESDKNFLLEMLTYFFYENKDAGVVRAEVRQALFEDFSLSNIFYASCASMHDNSLGEAGTIMAKFLGIKDNVYLISDVNLFLSAETKSGYIIEDEGTIVCWDNQEDPIVRAVLRTAAGEEYTPFVDEGTQRGGKKAACAIKNADIIIFSSGTQWSSLIPTYMHRGFRELIDNSCAKKYLVMNNAEDSDMLGVDADQLCDILGRYMNLSDIKIVLNDYAVDSMNRIQGNYSVIHGKIGEPGSRIHDSREVVKLIMKDYFAEPLNCKTVLYDLDGTLWNDRGDVKEKKIGKENLQMFHGAIISGNRYEHVKRVIRENCREKENFKIFADYGNTYFEKEDLDNPKVISHRYDISDALPEFAPIMENEGERIEIRGGVIATIKPVKDREKQVNKINALLSENGNKYIAKIAGNTSIDITRREFHKAVMVEMIINMFSFCKSEVLFVGNELKKGNEVEITQIGIHTLQVDDVYECNVFLRTQCIFDR